MQQKQYTWSISFVIVFIFAGLCFVNSSSAFPDLFSSNCGSCHNDDTATCGGCHYHNGNMTAQSDKTIYTAYEEVMVTLSRSGGQSGWVRVILYDHNGLEIARAAGPDGTGDNGLGNPVVLPQSLTAHAPLHDGEYTWEIAWYGTNNSGTAHIEERYPVTFTVIDAADVSPWWQAPELGPELNLAVFPNPISSNGSLKFSLGAHFGQTASLSIVDPAGRLLRTVASGDFGSGIQDIPWNGTDSAGSALPSGTYFAILSSGGDSVCRSVTILR